MSALRRTLAVAGLLSLSAAPSPAAAQQLSPPRLFEAAPPGAVADQLRRARLVRARRSRPARLQTAYLTAAAPEVVLNLFDDLQVTARRTRLDRRPNAFLWRGTVDGHPNAVATFAVTDGVAAGTVFLGGRTFEVLHTGGETYEVAEVDPAAFPPDDPLGAPAAEGQPDAFAAATPSAAADSGSTVDVMVVWTPNARVGAGGTSAVQSLVELAVANTNIAYENSRIVTRLRLVYSGEVAFTETPAAIATDLSALAATADGTLDGVHALRDQYGADVVTLLGQGYVSGGACGIAYLMGTPGSWFASSAFNVVDVACAAGNLSYAHEVGHNQGLHHDPPHASGSPSFPYAYGYEDAAGAFRTVMAYGASPRVPHFSNPAVAYANRVTGVADVQDNARALNATAVYVANFRPSVGASCTYTVSPSSLTFAAGGGSQSVTITTGPECAWTASSGTAWLTIATSGGTGSGVVTVSASANGTSPRSATITVAGQTLAVSQAAGACSYSVSPALATFASTASSKTVTVTTTAGCAWSASSTAGWVALGGASGTGAGSFVISVAANSAGARAASVAVGGRTVTVQQQAAPCTFTVAPTSLTFAGGGGTASVTVTAAAWCSWTLTNPHDWLTVSATTGTGSSTITLTARSTTVQRTGAVTLAGKTIAISQAPAQAPPSSPKGLRIVG